MTQLKFCWYRSIGYLWDQVNKDAFIFSWEESLTEVRGKLFRASTDRNKTELEKSYPEFNLVTKLDWHKVTHCREKIHLWL